MDLTRHADALREQLALATDGADDQTREAARRLLGPLDPAVRLVLQEALAEATEEITHELAPGSVDLRLRGRELGFVVTLPPALPEGPAPAPTPRAAPDADERGATARITFRPSEQLEADIEQAAEREGLSVNTYLCRTLTGVLRSPAAPPPPVPPSGSRFSGWVS